MKTLGLRFGVRTIGAAAIAIAIGATGCSDDDHSAPATTNTYQGGYVDSVGSVGSLSFTIQDATPTASRALGIPGVAVTGELVPAGGSPVALSGTYDPQTEQINLSGSGVARIAGGCDYCILGERGPSGAFSGSISTPFGSGEWVGLGVAAVSTATVFCGSYNCDVGCPGGETGSFHLVTFGSTAVVGVLTGDGSTLAAAGTRSGNVVSIDVETLSADGTIAGNGITGTYADSGSGESGTWVGSTGACVGR